MIECLTNLVGLKGLCEPETATPYFWIDDAEGLSRISIAELANSANGSGKQWAASIIEGSARFLLADIESLVPKGYSIKSSLNSFCNTCTYLGATTGTEKTGVIVKNLSTSRNSFLSIDSLKVMIGSTGTYTIVLDDAIEPKLIEHTFTAGTEATFTNINFKTSATSVKIYFLEAGVLVNALSCPTTKSCGCSGSSENSKDLSVKGLFNNTEFSTQYGFIPCASVVCSLDNILCNIVNQQPRLFALALFYRSVARVFSEPAVTERNNVFASFNKEEKDALATQYFELYYERLRGSSNVKGISDNMASALNNLNDVCVDCRRGTSIAWASG